jgi:molecular chaperone GrpE
MAGPEKHSPSAPPDEEAPGTGETAFSDGEAPPAGQRAEADASEPQDPAADGRPDEAADPAAASGAPEAEGDPAVDEGPDYLALAQRTQADFDNYRKRMARENAAALDRGVAKLARELLPALDHFELSLKAAQAHSGKEADVARGFGLVRDELVSALAKVGITPFSPTGEPFDPTEHEAMASVPAEETAAGTVVEVYQQGYRINGAVLRPARVVVAQ